MAQDTQWLISTNLVPARVRVGPTQCAETALPTSCSNDSHSVRREPSSPNPCLLLLLLRMRHIRCWIYHAFTHSLVPLFLFLLSSSPPSLPVRLEPLPSSSRPPASSSPSLCSSLPRRTTMHCSCSSSHSSCVILRRLRMAF